MASDRDSQPGLEVAEINQHNQQRDDGKQVVFHSDKQFIPTVAELDKKEAISDKEHYIDEKSYPHSQDAPSPQSNRRRYCGLKRNYFIAAIIAVTLIIIAAAVGGGVAGSMAHKSNKSDSVTITPTTTITAAGAGQYTSTVLSTNPSSSTIPPSNTATSSSSSTSSNPRPATATTIPSSGMGAYHCPSDNSTNYKSSLSPGKYKILCDADFPQGAVGINGGTVQDLNTGVIATSIDACIDQCAANRAGGGGCTAVAYGANITLALSRGGITGNCFIKDQRGKDVLEDNSGQAMAAYLISASN